MDENLRKQLFPNIQPTQSMAGSSGSAIANNGSVQTIAALNARNNATAQGAASNQYDVGVRPQDMLKPRQTGISQAAKTFNVPDVSTTGSFNNSYSSALPPQSSASDLMRRQYEQQLQYAGDLVKPTGYNPNQAFEDARNRDIVNSQPLNINPYNRTLFSDTTQTNQELRDNWVKGNVSGVLGSVGEWSLRNTLGGVADLGLLGLDNSLGRGSDYVMEKAGIPQFGSQAVKKVLPPPVNSQQNAPLPPTANAPLLPNRSGLPTYGQFDPIKFQGRAIDNAMAQQYTGGNLNLPNAQFDRNNLQANYEAALNAPGTTIDTSQFNQMNNGFMGQNAEDLARVNEQKLKIAETIAALEGSMATSKDTLGNTKDWSKLFSAVGDIKLDKSKRDELLKLQGQLTSQDNTLAQQQQAKLMEEALNTERLRTFKQPEFAQDLAKTNLSAQNNVDLNMQSYDQRMAEIGVNSQAQNIASQRAYQQDLAKAKVGLVSPTNVSQAFNVSNEMRNSALSRQMLFDPDPAKRLAAQQELIAVRTASGKTAEAPKLQAIPDRVDGVAENVNVFNPATGEMTSKLTQAGMKKRANEISALLKANVNPDTDEPYTDAEREALKLELAKYTVK